MPRKTPAKPDLAELDSIEAISEKLREVRATRTKLERANLHGSTTAITALHRLELDCLKAIARIRAAASAPVGAVEAKSKEDLLAEAASIVGGTPTLRLV